MKEYERFYGFKRTPFAQDIPTDDLYPIAALAPLADRILYAIDLRAVTVVTGDVGAGKSTSLRYAASKLHPSGFRVMPVVAHTGTFKEFLKQLLLALDREAASISLTTLIRSVKNGLAEIAEKKRRPVILVDEANLMRLEVFEQIHTLMQFEYDSKPVASLVLCGQPNLLDKLHRDTSRPLASRVVGRTHLDPLTRKEMEGYLHHHLCIAGIKEMLFTDEAVLAILQASGGLLRRANAIARGALIAAANEKSHTVSPEQVRLATTEII